MIKFRWYYDKDKEEEFLNKMSSKGYAMKKFILGFYFFEKSTPNEYTYRVDLIRDKTEKELHEYISLIEESGADFIQKWGFWAFFRKKGEFELYTDIDSQISLYKRIRTTYAIFTGMELCFLPSQIHNIYFNSIFMYLSILLSVVIIAFLYQIYKCSKKIKELEKKL